jgi:hypothetical protein
LTVGSKSIEECLNINGEFSYWWMSLVAEKSPFKSKSTENIVKLLALEKILIEKGVKKISFVGSNRQLSKAFSRLCQNLNISYDFLYKKNQNQEDLNVLNYMKNYTWKYERQPDAITGWQQERFRTLYTVMIMATYEAKCADCIFVVSPLSYVFHLLEFSFHFCYFVFGCLLFGEINDQNLFWTAFNQAHQFLSLFFE